MLFENSIAVCCASPEIYFKAWLLPYMPFCKHANVNEQ